MKYRIGDLLTQAKDSEYISHPEDEKFVTVSGKGKGATRRNIADGKTPVPFSGYRVKSGQLIYSRIGASDGAFGIIPDDLNGAVVSKDFPIFWVNEDLVLKDYLLAFLCSKAFVEKAKRYSDGATLKRLREDVLLSTETEIPSIREQRYVLSVLDKVKRAQALNSSRVKRLDDLIKARFVEMFGNKNTADNVLIGEAVELINGRAFKPTDWTVSGLPIIRIQNLNDPKAPYNHFDGSYDKKNYVEKGELLFSWSGTPGTSFGAFIWDREPGLLNQHIFRVLPKKDYDLKFLRFALNAQLDEIISKAHGGVGLQHITKSELERISIPYPSREQQAVFSDFVAQVDKSKFAIQKSLEKTQLLFDSLMQEYFG